MYHLGKTHSFTIYNASAGSGKTFALVKAYLKKIITHPQNSYFKHLLAITFTNKAVAEMKSRIIATLVGFSSESIPKTDLDMLQLLVEETGLSEEKIKIRSKEILKYILHHYAQFSVETIDHFNHRLIRTFARDLNLPPHFEVSLEVNQLISKAVDRLIDTAGEDPEVTKLLLEFALQKTDDDKSWDIAFDLKKAAQLLANENDAHYIRELKDKSLADFLSLRKKLRKEAQVLMELIRANGEQVLSLFGEHNLTKDHFSRGHLYTFFEKIASGVIPPNFNAAYLNTIGDKPMYAVSKVQGATADLMDSLAPRIDVAVKDIKEKSSRYALIKNILKNIVPIATVNLVNQELQKIKEEENLLPINEFNALIHEQVKDQPAPFIYERLGDRYRDFFIDEFQDTSLLQWTNLMPLIENAISQAYEDEGLGSLLLVGDAKQSIYRWRGGLPEQFIDLYNHHTPFSLQPHVLNLATNYRSRAEIITFNNAFFSFVAEHFGDETHQQLYTLGNQQESTSKDGGFVKIEFIPKEKPEDRSKNQPNPYAIKVLESVNDALALGYQKKDICVLTRRKKEGVLISEHLLEHDIAIVSEETLLLKNAPTVQCLVQIVQLSVMPQNEEVKIEFLSFLYELLHLSPIEDQHNFFQAHIHEPLEKLSETLKVHGIDFGFKSMQHLSLFESMEYSIERLGLDKMADTFLTSFMDLIFTFSQRFGASKNSFLDFWAEKMDSASISGNKSNDAVQVMTIHKSKGLEFPVVIFPYANLNIYREMDPVAWYPWNEDGFRDILIDYKKELIDYGPIGAEMSSKRNHQLELDNINLLYVVLTRAVDHLYIYAEEATTKNPPDSYNSFLVNFLKAKQKWSEGMSLYSFGVPLSKLAHSEAKSHHSEIQYKVSSPEAHHIKLLTTEADRSESEQNDAIEIGNLLHDAMALIKTSEEMEQVLSELKIKLGDDPQIFSEIKKRIERILTHPGINHLFEGNDLIFNERDIITQERIFRPDRLNIHSDKSVTIIDYKTGAPNEAYETQINGYAMVLQDMGYTVKDKLLVYANHDGISINKT